MRPSKPDSMQFKAMWMNFDFDTSSLANLSFVINSLIFWMQSASQLPLSIVVESSWLSNIICVAFLLSNKSCKICRIFVESSILAM